MAHGWHLGTWLLKHSLYDEVILSYIWTEHLPSTLESGLLVIVVWQRMPLCPALNNPGFWVLHRLPGRNFVHTWLHFCCWRDYALGVTPSLQGESMESLQVDSSILCLVYLLLLLIWLCILTLLLQWFLAQIITLCLVTWIHPTNHQTSSWSWGPLNIWNKERWYSLII